MSYAVPMVTLRKLLVWLLFNYEVLCVRGWGAKIMIRTYGNQQQLTFLRVATTRPEIYNGRGYQFEVDLFAFGVVLFRLLSDERPFPIENSAQLKRRTIELRYQVVGEDWDMVSQNGKDMVRKLLINPRERLTAEQALRHPWMYDATQSRLRVQGTLSREYHQAGARRNRSRNAILEVRKRRAANDTKRARRQSKLTIYFLVCCTCSKPPPEQAGSMTLGISSKYWIDMSLKEALEMLIFTGTFQAKLVEQQSGNDGAEGLICYREITPPSALTLANHIGGFDRYTERNCRDIFKSLVSRVQILHESSVAHRNLHPDNVLVQPDVRMFRFSCVLARTS
jgi:Protein kinase domain